MVEVLLIQCIWNFQVCTNVFFFLSNNFCGYRHWSVDCIGENTTAVWIKVYTYICKIQIDVQSLIDVQSSNPCLISTTQTSGPQIYVLFSNSQIGVQWHHCRMFQIMSHPLGLVGEATRPDSRWGIIDDKKKKKIWSKQRPKNRISLCGYSIHWLAVKNTKVVYNKWK